MEIEIVEVFPLYCDVYPGDVELYLILSIGNLFVGRGEMSSWGVADVNVFD